MRVADAEARMLDLVNGAEPADPGEPGRLFPYLDPVLPAFMHGTWEGGLFDENDPMGATLTRMRWYGKRFRDDEDVEPLLCRDEDGAIHSFTGMGLARLRAIAYRGTLSAAMVYDDRPIIDHFRRVTDDVVAGAMDAKGQDSVLYFHLTRRPEA
ncbi:DUF4334 domain-containing protein [Actinomadura viridis]|uniref:DUF4334 domain-containing protein n=1 Tax=Actinomadura viridis TaxID=58110 RepID=A0A931DSJ6_9ACTN|nr:DUF4334 domain-containing protein [Actinomadura viridis]MBG6091913.1 hypothetical protein [Actinomadura viridis]